MSWSIRTYRRGDTSTHYTCDRHRRFALPPELTITRPWAGSIRADYVLSTRGAKDALTGLRAVPSAPQGTYTGDVRHGGQRRHLVAMRDEARGILVIGIYGRSMPRYRRRQVTERGVAVLTPHLRNAQAAADTERATPATPQTPTR